MLKNFIRTIFNRFFRGNNLPFAYKISMKIGGGNNLIIGSKSNIYQSSIKFLGNNCLVVIGDGCHIKGLNILMGGECSRIVIENDTVINACKKSPTVINSFEGKSIVIKEGCMFSNGIEIHNTDYHSILNSLGKRINHGKDIYIGKHTWIGLRSVLLKGTKIQDNTIVGANSVVNKEFNESNIVIAGNPAVKRKGGIDWIR